MDATLPTLQVLIGSTRPTRVGDAIARWFVDVASARGDLSVELVDLKEMNLPLLDEPEQPMRHQYEHEHTKRWAATVERADAVVFVIPEYNHGLSAAVKNAVDFLYVEWHYKPFGIVSYGGMARGLRAAQALKPSLIALKMPWTGDVAVSIQATPVVDHVFAGDDMLVRSATAMLNEVVKLTPLYQTLRS